LISGRDKRFMSSPMRPDLFGVHEAYFLIDREFPSMGMKWPGLDTDRSPPCNAETRKRDITPAYRRWLSCLMYSIVEPADNVLSH